MIKRLFDLSGSAIGFAILSPLLLVLTLIVKVTSPGPVFYRGLRAGRFGRPFRILKFRSMVVDAEQRGGPSSSDDDPRVTWIGAIMRRYKLDEFPQLVNVLVGQMSLVGPRPEVLSEVAEYTPEQRKVLDLRPGITDWASLWNSDEGRVLAGASDPHLVYKARIQPTKLRLQLKYRDEQSLWLDLTLIAYTVFKIVRRDWVPEELKPFGRP